MSGTRMNIKPAFQAEFVKGTFTRTVTRIHEDVRSVGALDKKIITRSMTQEQEEFEDGWMVYFPQGHSLFIASDDTDQLMRIGVTEPPHRVDMESGEIVPDDFELTPKEIVERATHNRPRPFGAPPRRETGGLTELMGDKE